MEYGSEEIPGATRIVNPAWRGLDKQITRLNTRLRSHQAKLGAAPPPDPDDGQKIAQRAALLETIQNFQTERDALKIQRRATPHKIAIQELPEAERPCQLRPLARELADARKVVAQGLAEDGEDMSSAFTSASPTGCFSDGVAVGSRAFVDGFFEQSRE